MTGDEKIATVLCLETAHVQVPGDLRERITSAAAEPHHKSRWLACTAAGFVASVLMLAALPGPRAAATDVIRRVFHRGGVEFVVQSGTEPAPETAEPAPLTPAHDAPGRSFDTEAGALPPDGVAAVKRLDPHFRLPTWLPEAMPKQLLLPPEGWPGGVFNAYYHLAIGNRMSVGAKYPGWGVLQVQGGKTKIETKPVVLAGAEGLEVRVGSEIRYYVKVDDVAYTFSAPLSQEAELRKIAESLARIGP